MSAPTGAQAQVWQPLVICGQEGTPCNFGHLVQVARNLITNLITLSTLLATAAFAYAGIVLLSSGGSEQAKNKAKDIFKKVLIGYLWILGAWLLVYAITSALLAPGFSAIT